MLQFYAKPLQKKELSMFRFRLMTLTAAVIVVIFAICSLSIKIFSHFNAFRAISRLKFTAIPKSEFSFTLSGVVPSLDLDLDLDPSVPGSDIREISSQVTATVLLELSDQVEERVTNMFAPFITRQSWFFLNAFQVSCLPTSERELRKIINTNTSPLSLLCVFRVWQNLAQFESGMLYTADRYQDSFMYSMQLDENLDFIEKSGHLVNIPSPIQDIYYSGPEDPRLFELGGTVFVNFILGHSDIAKHTVRRQFLWSIADSVMYDIEIENFVMHQSEKNWTPWVFNDTLHFVYEFFPVFRILECHIEETQRTVKCFFAFGQPREELKTEDLILRGGSPLVHYVDEYYIAVTHSVQHKFDGKVYAAQLCLINSHPYRIVFISSPIFIDPKLMYRIRMVDASLRRPFVYARSVFVDSPDSLLIGAGVNDNTCFLFRLQGIAAMLEEAIDNDRKQFKQDDNSVPNSNIYQSMEQWLAEVTLNEVTKYFPH